MDEVRREQVHEVVWQVERQAVVDEVLMENGHIKFNVKINDSGRKPFMSRWFGDPVSASDFIDTIRLGIPSGRGDRHERT